MMPVPIDMDRRRFVGVAACMCAAVALDGCASVAAIRVAPVNGTLRLPLDTYPDLAVPGGFLRIQPEGHRSRLYVLALDDGSYVALSPICTHRGCTVNVEGTLLVCPCHGSTYNRAGSVIRGPAERSLERFPLTMEEDRTLVVAIDNLP